MLKLVVVDSEGHKCVFRMKLFALPLNSEILVVTSVVLSLRFVPGVVVICDAGSQIVFLIFFFSITFKSLCRMEFSYSNEFHIKRAKI